MILGFLLVTGLLAPVTSSPSAAAISIDVPSSVEAIFAGGVPETIDDLRAMEHHFHELAIRVRPATVGLRIAGSEGSGVIVSADGLVLTAAHVVGEGAAGRRVDVVLSDGRHVEGETLGADHDSDAALVRLRDSSVWPHVELGHSRNLKSGQWCLATGHPGGYEPGRAPPVRVGRVLRNRGGFVTSDCVLVGGDSGGPLFDMSGRVIGIHSRITRSTAGNLHVQADRFHDGWDRMLGGEVWPEPPPFLGVYLDDRAREARIDEVMGRTPASEAGLKTGDIVLSYDGRTVGDNRELRAALERSKVGDKVKLRVRRGDDAIELEVVLGSRERGR
ncbi:MAG: trypsin-like peptidase domain-containing protein [Planctomycetes bacterium]|nr:trypsin-like peptidase domain-containing protein [Planctomycetota bacterium]